MLWNEIKTTFETEVLCPALRGRVRFEYTDFDDDRDNCLSIHVDSKPFYAFDTKDYTEQFSVINGRLRHTIQDVLSENYTSRSDAVEASWDIVNEFIPWVTSQTGIMRAEHAVRNMKEFIGSSNPNDLRTRNEFTYVLWFLSKYLSGDAILAEKKREKQACAGRWYCPFVKLRIEAEKVHRKTQI